jgi:hypothetical protein
VIVEVNRNQTVAGTVQLENEDVIVIRTLEDSIESFPRARVLRVVYLVDPEPGQRGVVYLRNGQFREGIVIEDAYDHVIIEIEGIRARLRRPVVSHVQLAPTFEERYRNYKKSLEPGMTDHHLVLCRWLFKERRYQLALQELKELLASAPDHPEALRLFMRVQAQLDLKESRRDPADAPAATAPAAEPDPRAGPVRLSDLLPKELVSAADVNIMRVYEIDFEDPPMVSIEPDTIRRLLEHYGASPLLPKTSAERTALFRADPLEIVRIMFELRARELYPEIEVFTEPRALNLFRQRVHNTWLMNNCATSRCHGGLNGGRLFLHNRNYRDRRVRYTNLLILERLDLDQQWPLIDFASPADSLIIQYGLPREMARRAHPDVKGWKPVFGRQNQRLLRESIAWIESMMQPRPPYPVEYEPPVLLGTGVTGEATEKKPGSPRTPR